MGIYEEAKRINVHNIIITKQDFVNAFNEVFGTKLRIKDFFKDEKNKSNHLNDAFHGV